MAPRTAAVTCGLLTCLILASIPAVAEKPEPPVVWDGTRVICNIQGSPSLCIPLDASWNVVVFDGSGACSGPADPGDPCQVNDDDYTLAIPLAFTFDLYGAPQTSVNINNNGNLSFGGGFCTYTSTGFPVAGFPMVAPFWADVDTRNIANGAGVVYSKSGPNYFAVTWDHVGYYNAHSDRQNTFQVIISDGTFAPMGLGNNVCFCYGDMGWTTGDASGGIGGFGGTPATVGVNKGDGVNYFVVGRFDHPGTDYDGPGGAPDGVDYLDGQHICFNVGAATNQPPVGINFPPNDRICVAAGQTLNFSVGFIGPEGNQIVHTIVNDGGLLNFSYTSTDGNPSIVAMTFSPDQSQIGDHPIQLTAVDNFNPPGITTRVLTLCVEPPPAPCEVCGPGPHWIHIPGCPPGTDSPPSAALVGIDFDLDCLPDANLVLSGPVTVQRSGPRDDSNNFPGLRPVDGHLDVIDTEIIAMSLTGGGFTLTAGAGQGGIPLQPSDGAMAEQPVDPSVADSFFDVFFEVSGGGQPLYNQVPLRINSNITCIIPDATYEHPQGCIPLYTSPIPGQGVHVANLVTANHNVFATGACCTGNVCAISREDECLAQGGAYQGDNTTCTPNPCVPPAPCDVCGPGPHWIHNPPCPPGTDSPPSAALVGVDFNLDCQPDVNLVLSGPVSVRRTGPRDDSNNFPGLRPVDGHLDVIDTEIVAMSLTGSGYTLTAGAGQGGIPLRASNGAMAELPVDPSLANSFFDVFFEVSGGGQPLYNQVPLRINSDITCIIPDATYSHPQGCIPLFTSPIPGQGVHVANLVTANHNVFATGACCTGDTCAVTREDECLAQGGAYQGDNTTCTPNPCVPPAPCDVCGPGPHWIHQTPCPPGTDNPPSGAVVGIDLNLDCLVDQNLVLGGPVTIRRTGPLDDSNNFPGLRPVDGHRDVIDTEIIAMSLTGGGFTLTAGAGQGGIPLRASDGAIAEQPSDPLLADSFFDVFFEVSGGGQPLYNQTPLRLGSTISCLPPDATYSHPQGCIPLYTSPIPGQGVHVANLVTANHDVFPPPAEVGETGAPSGSQPLLLGTSPNPAHGQAAINFYLPEARQVRLEVYDVSGRLVRIVTARTMPAGPHSVVWDLRDQQGRNVAKGVYQYSLKVGETKLTGKLTVIE